VSGPLITLPGPLFFFIGAFLLAALAYALNRWSLLSGGVAAAGSLLLAWVALRQLDVQPLPLPSQALDLSQVVALDPKFELLGRTWALTSSSLAGLCLIYGLAGLALFFALPTPHGWAFYAFGLAVLGMLSMALTAQQYVYALLFTWLAACLAVFVLSGGRPGDTTAGLRTLVFTSLGIMPMLLLPNYVALDAGGYAGTLDFGRTPLPAEAIQTASLLLTMGMAILLMMVPFHGQLVAMGANATPMAPAFMLAVFPTVVLHTLFRLFEAQPALLQEPLAFQVSRWMGILTAGLGGLAALGQRRWGSLVGYAMLVSWGAGLLALGRASDAGTEHATLMLVWRVIGLLLAGVGWGALYGAIQQCDDLDRCRGLLRRRPLSVVALVLGLLSLAGFPLSPGGLARWHLLGRQALTQPPAEWTAGVVVLVLAGVGVSLGTLAALRSCLDSDLSRAADQGDGTAQTVEDEDEKRLARWRLRSRETLQAMVHAAMSGLALWLAASLFLRPEPWIKVARQLLGGLSFPVG
jgi:formate hydrogenlyase subunit 3/multisubunit Na+/H+ antiporter MnhD subunit